MISFPCSHASFGSHLHDLSVCVADVSLTSCQLRWKTSRELQYRYNYLNLSWGGLRFLMTLDKCSDIICISCLRALLFSFCTSTGMRANLTRVHILYLNSRKASGWICLPFSYKGHRHFCVTTTHYVAVHFLAMYLLVCICFSALGKLVSESS